VDINEYNYGINIEEVADPNGVLDVGVETWMMEVRVLEAWRCCICSLSFDKSFNRDSFGFK
jgi:hypothetical protein